jgi:hypothetical protein
LKKWRQKRKNLKQIGSISIDFFDMKFKSKKTLTQPFYIQKRDRDAENGELSCLKDIKTKCFHPLETKFDTRIIKDLIGRF